MSTLITIEIPDGPIAARKVTGKITRIRKRDGTYTIEVEAKDRILPYMGMIQETNLTQDQKDAIEDFILIEGYRW